MSPMGGMTPPASQVNAIEMEKVRGKKEAAGAEAHAGRFKRAGNLTNDPVSLPAVPSGAGGAKQPGFGAGTNLGRYKSFRRRGM